MGRGASPIFVAECLNRPLSHPFEIALGISTLSAERSCYES